MRASPGLSISGVCVTWIFRLWCGGADGDVLHHYLCGFSSYQCFCPLLLRFGYLRGSWWRLVGQGLFNWLGRYKMRELFCVSICFFCNASLAAIHSAWKVLR